MKKKTNEGQKSMGAIIMEICIIMKQKRGKYRRNPIMYLSKNEKETKRTC